MEIYFGEGICFSVLNFCLNWHKRDVPSCSMVSASYKLAYGEVHLFLTWVSDCNTCSSPQTFFWVVSLICLRMQWPCPLLGRCSLFPSSSSKPQKILGCVGPSMTVDNLSRNLYFIAFILVWHMKHLPRCHFLGLQKDSGHFFSLTNPNL